MLLNKDGKFFYLYFLFIFYFSNIILYLFNREEPVRKVGIAGIRNFDSVKCLHCHYAHYLGQPSHENLIGNF